QEIEDLPENVGSLETIEKKKTHAASLEDATPETRQKIIKAFDDAQNDLRERLVTGALSELDEVRESFTEIPLTMEGWDDVVEGRKLVDRFGNRYSTSLWEIALRDAGQTEEVAERLEELSTILAGLEEAIPFAVIDSILAELKE